MSCYPNACTPPTVLIPPTVITRAVNHPSVFAFSGINALTLLLLIAMMLGAGLVMVAIAMWGRKDG